MKKSFLSLKAGEEVVDTVNQNVVGLTETNEKIQEVKQKIEKLKKRDAEWNSLISSKSNQRKQKQGNIDLSDEDILDENQEEKNQKD